jgi:hypothetical protein
MAGHRRREAAAEQARQEGAQDTEVRGGRERGAWCQEAEVREPFIGCEGKRGGREAGGQAVAGGASLKHQLQKRR